MPRRYSVMLFVVALLVAVGAAALGQADETFTLRYAPPVGSVASYDATVEGNLTLSLAPQPIPVKGAISYALAPKEIAPDGTVSEEVTYTAISGELMGQKLNSQYVGKTLKAKRAANGAYSVSSDSLPLPQLMGSADLMVLFVPFVRMVQLPDQPVKVGDKWEIERQPIPPMFAMPARGGPGGNDGQAGPMKLTKTYMTQTSELREIKEHEGRKVAILATTVRVLIEGEELMPGLPVNGELAANMESAAYVDTGELIEANAMFAGTLAAQYQGTDIEFGFDSVKGRYVCTGTKAPETPAPPAGEGQAGEPAAEQ